MGFYARPRPSRDAARRSSSRNPCRLGQGALVALASWRLVCRPRRPPTESDASMSVSASGTSAACTSATSAERFLLLASAGSGRSRVPVSPSTLLLASKRPHDPGHIPPRPPRTLASASSRSRRWRRVTFLDSPRSLAAARSLPARRRASRSSDSRIAAILEPSHGRSSSALACSSQELTVVVTGHGACQLAARVIRIRSAAFTAFSSITIAGASRMLAAMRS